jgi:AcrR family transcriptional regulator
MRARAFPKAKRPRWHRRPDARPDELMTAAVEVFGEVGYAQAKLEDVAKRAGVSKGTVYLYFESKDALFRAMVRHRVADHLAFAEAAVAGSTKPPRELLDEIIRRWWAATPSLIQINRVIHAEATSFPELARFYLDEVILRGRRLLRLVFERGVEQGDFRRIPPVPVLRGIASMIVHGAMYQRLFGPHDPDAVSDDQLIDGILDLVFHGINSPSPRPGRSR